MEAGLGQHAAACHILAGVEPGQPGRTALILESGIEIGVRIQARYALQREIYLALLAGQHHPLPVLIGRHRDQPGDTVLGHKVTGITYKDRTTDALHTVELEGIFVQIGLLPNSDWLKGTVELNRFGEIIVDAKGATNIPGVFAAGDVTTVPYKQIVIAMGEGAKASLAAFDHLIRSSAPA